MRCSTFQCLLYITRADHISHRITASPLDVLRYMHDMTVLVCQKPTRFCRFSIFLQHTRHERKDEKALRLALCTLHMMSVRMAPEDPISAPTTVSSGLSSMKPSAQRAQPEYEFRTVITLTKAPRIIPQKRMEMLFEEHTAVGGRWTVVVSAS